LVTGAGRRVGRAIALELARRGCDVAVHCLRSVEEAHQTAADIRQSGRRAVVLAADLAEAGAAAGLPNRCREALGGLDLLVNNAAVFEPTGETFDAARWNRTLAINLTAPAILAFHAAPLMSEGGSIINISDIAGDRPWPSYAAYCASKAGLTALTKSLAAAFAPRIRVNGVAPGVADWPDEYDEAKRQRLTARIPAGRAGTPEEVAAAVRFLAEDATYVTGIVLAVDGGRNVSW
jgi:pteridine reductase